MNIVPQILNIRTYVRTRLPYRAWKAFPAVATFILVNWFPKAIPDIAAELEQQGRFDEALQLVQKRRFTGWHPRAMAAALPRYLSKSKRHSDLQRWFDDFYPELMVEPFTKRNRQFRTPITRVADELNIDGPRRELIIAAKETVSSGGKGASAAVTALRDYRMFEFLEDAAFTKGATLAWSSLAPTIEAKKHCSKIAKWVSLASLNEELHPGHRKATGPSPDLEVFIPIHFFATWDERMGAPRKDNWKDIRDGFEHFYDRVTESGRSIQPRHQYFLNFACPSPGVPSISFFTKGGLSKHWHMRDTGIKNHFSIDPDGYWGSSSLSLVDLKPYLASMSDEPEDIALSVSRLRSWFSSQGGNKYSSVDAGDDAIDENAIFVPLQAPNGLEETQHSLDELIAILTRYSRDHGVRVYLRRHPLDRSQHVTALIDRAVSRSMCQVSNASPWALTTKTAATVTLNSATVMLPIAAGKPVFTWGQTDTHSVCHDIGSYDDFVREMDAVRHGSKSLTVLQERFCHFYLSRYLVDLTSSESVRRRLDLVLELSKHNDSSHIRNEFIDELFR